MSHSYGAEFSYEKRLRASGLGKLLVSRLPSFHALSLSVLFLANRVAASPYDMRSCERGIDGLKPGFYPTYARFTELSYCDKEMT
jgi:hypothetical protein